MLILRVNNIYTDLVGEISSQHYKDLEKKLSFRPQGYQFTPAYNNFVKKDGQKLRRFWDGWKRQCWRNNKKIYFPTGLISIAKSHLVNLKYEVRIQDLRTKHKTNFELETREDVEYRDYQQAVIDESCQRSRGIIQAATGSGKTVIASGIIQKLGVSPFIFFVTSIDLLTQAKKSIEDFLTKRGESLTVGQIGAGVIDIRDINVMTVQTAVRALGKSWNKSTKFDSDDSDDKTPIEKYKDDIKKLIRTAKGSICDEVQHWRADTCQLVSKEMSNAYYTYGMSATPYRDEGDDMMIRGCFGRKIGEISASQLISDGWLVRPDIKMVHVKGEKTRYRQWSSIYKEQVVENEKYNSYVANIANAYIQQNRVVLALVQQLNHGRYLESMIPGSVFLSGRSPKKARESRLDQLRNKEISCIISTVIFDEGIDVRPLDTVILAGQGKSRVRAMQRVGRVLRPYEDEHTKKEKATVVDFIIHQKYLKKHAVEREKMYRTEPEFHIDEIDPTME